MKTLADRLKSALSTSGASKTDIWKACGISSGAVSQWFNGSTQEIEGKNLIAAAQVLKVNPNWLATGEGSREPGKQITTVSIDPILDDLAALLPEDAEVWRAQIRAAAIKARREKEEKRERQEQGVADPPLISRRVSSI